MKTTPSTDEFAVDVAGRLAPYDIAPQGIDDLGMQEVDEAPAEKAMTLLAVMPRNQHRTTIERLVAPDEPVQGRRVVDALIAGGCVAEDHSGRLRLLT